MTIKRFSFCFVLAAGLLWGAENGYNLFQKGLAKERADADPRTAIKIYEQVVRENATDHKLAAQALIRLAECYEKLGVAGSRKAYEQIVRDYADQKEAVAVAQAKLRAAGSITAVKGDRSVWTGPKVDLFGRVSPDGRYISFVDWDTLSLMVHDVEANQDHVLTPPSPNLSQQAGASVFSRDGKRLAYVWSESGRQGLRIAEFRGNQILEPRQFFLADEGVRFLSMGFDWSPDGKWIAVAVKRKGGVGQIALISVADGSSRVLKSMDWNVPERIFFSPDSNYIAYAIPTTDANRQRDVYVLAIDGSRESRPDPHPAQDEVIGWSPDGTRLLFTSDRTGSTGIWTMRIAEGKAAGEPGILRSGCGGFSLGVTASGSLYFFRGTGDLDVKIASIDLGMGKLLGSPSNFVQGFLERVDSPNWSPDGKYLAYSAEGGGSLAIRSVDTGQVRTLTELPYVFRPQWSPDGRTLLAGGRDAMGRDGVFHIDARTGKASAVVFTTGLGVFPRWSPDGRKIYYIKRPDIGIVERDLASGTEREVIRHPRMQFGVNLSPDGRYLAVQTGSDPSSKTSSLLLVPVAGGESRELSRLAEPDRWESSSTTVWTPDSKAILKVKNTGSGPELLLIPVDGAAPRKLAIDSSVWSKESQVGLDNGFDLSPDGGKLAFRMGKSEVEVWAIENVLPANKASR